MRSFADPLELNEASRIGTPGLVGGGPAGSVTLVNALGSGVLETRALLAFLPRIAEALHGEPLKLPNIATWWCGQQAERDACARPCRPDDDRPGLVHPPAVRDRQAPMLGRPAARRPQADLDDWLDAQGAGLVGQELVTLSTTPVYVDGALVPRPMTLRVFLARTPRAGR